MKTLTYDCYLNFINSCAKSQKLPIGEMQTFGEWIENRRVDFEYQVAVCFLSAKQIRDGFESWLIEMYA